MNMSKGSLVPEKWAIWSRKNMDDISIQEVSDVETFRSLRETWNNLLRESGDNNIFLTWEWLFTWWQHYGRDKKLRILLIKESDRIIAIAPFMQWKYRKGIFNIDVIENLCSIECDYSGIILTERRQESVAILLDCLVKITRDCHVIVRMSHIPENSDFISVLREQYPAFSSSFLLIEQPVSSCPYIMLPANWEDFFSTISKKRRQHLRQATKTLQKDHVVEFKKYDGGDDLREQLQVLFELHQKRWQDKNIISKFIKPEARDFYLDVSKAFYQNNWLDFSFLNVDGKPVSAAWGFNYNNEFCYMTCTFDPDYSNYGVGNLHIMKLIEYSIQNGQRKFDFLKGNEAFKNQWTHFKTNNFQITMAKNGFWGRYRVKLLRILIKYDNFRARSFRDNLSLFLKKVRR
jgi:CelD/BcsL family acetyltransferase involved in cellulose biosynthesis